MFATLKKLFTKEQPTPQPVAAPPESPPPKPKKPRKPRKPAAAEPPRQLSEKEQATERGEPYVKILSLDIDSADPHNGSFTLDFNDKFVANLIRAGYKMREDDTDERIVDRWFQTVCRNIALEVYEQEQADPRNRTDDTNWVRRKNLGDGRTEVS